jgi:hypothetical protein
MEIFVSCLGDLATIGGPVVFVTPVPSPLLLSLSFVCQTLGIRKYLSWQFHCALARGVSGEVVMWAGWKERDARLSGHIFGGSSVSKLSGYSLRFTDFSLQFTVSFNLAPWTGYPLLPRIE